MLILTGRSDMAKAVDEGQKAFGSLANPEVPLDRTETKESPQDGERTVTLRRVGDVGAVGLIYHIPSGAHPDFAAVQVLAEMLGASPSGRVHELLVDPGQASAAGPRPGMIPGF